MPAVTAAEFITTGKFKKFACMDQDQVQDELDQAECFDCPYEKWGKFQRRGIMLMAAHRLAMDLDDTSIIVGQSAQLAQGGGSNPRSERAPGIEGDELSMTTFGNEFYRLAMRIAVAGARLT